MSDGAPEAGDFWLIELHDAFVRGVELRSEGRVEVRLSLNAYRRIAPARSEVWECEAKLTLAGVNAFELNGTIGEREFVIDGEVMGNTGPIPLIALVAQSSPIHSVRLKAGTFELEAKATTCQLEGLRAARFLEHFEG